MPAARLESSPPMPGAVMVDCCPSTKRAKTTRTIEAKHVGKIVLVEIPEDADVKQLRAACGLSISKLPKDLTLLCAGRKITNDALAVADVLPACGRLMIISRTPGPLPRLTMHDAHRETVAHAVEVPAGATVLDLISVARAALKFPISVSHAALYSSHLAVFLEDSRLVSEYNLPFHSEAYLVARPSGDTAPQAPSASLRLRGPSSVVPRVSSRLRGSTPVVASRLAPPPSPTLPKRMPDGPKSVAVAKSCTTAPVESTPSAITTDAQMVTPATTVSTQVNIGNITRPRSRLGALEVVAPIELPAIAIATAATSLAPTTSVRGRSNDTEQCKLDVSDGRISVSIDAEFGAPDGWTGRSIGQRAFNAGLITTRSGGHGCGRGGSVGVGLRGASSSPMRARASHVLSCDRSTSVNSRKSLPGVRDLQACSKLEACSHGLAIEGLSSPLRPPACVASARTVVARKVVLSQV